MSSIVKPFIFNPVQENTYLLIDEATKKAVIIDPGCMDRSEFQTMDRVLEQYDATPVALVLTHLHFDHIWGVPYVVEKYGLQPQAHPQEIDFMPSFNEQVRLFMLPEDQARKDPGYAPILPGEEIVFGESRLKVLFLPGHSIAHIAFYNESDHYVVSGDALFRMGIGRTDLPGGNYDRLIQSITTQLYTLPEETVVYSGHGPMTTIGFEKYNNPYTV